MRAIPNRRYVTTACTAPGPVGQSMLGSFGAIRKNPLAYLDSVWRTYGDVVQFPVPKPPSYLVNDPDGVRSVLVTNARSYGKSTIQYSALSLVTGEGLLSADTAEWKRQRPMVQPAFHRETLTTIVSHVATAAERIIEDWNALTEGAVVDIDAAIMNAALEVVGHALFGSDLSTDADVLTTATLDALDVVIARARVPITPPAWVPTPGNRKLSSSVAALDRAVHSMLDSRGVREVPADMLDLLITARDDEGHALTETEIRDQVVTFIVAGHETVASALTWTFALLAENPEVMRLLQAEADAVLGGNAAQFADYQRLPYARAVIDETLRLYPPAWLITRNSLGDDSLGGYEVPEGSLIIMSPWLLHRHPGVWANPDRFDPQRFIDGEIDRSAFIPFGAGPRQCIGRDFAYVEAVLLLSSLVAHFDLEYPAGQQRPPAVPLVTMRPANGLHLRVSARSGA
jgi:cytochrome P450